MDRVKEIASREKEIKGMGKSCASNTRLLLDLLPQVRQFMQDIPELAGYPAADADGSYKALRIRIGIALGDSIIMSEKAVSTARDLTRATDGAPLTLEAPDRSDENWEERHREYVALMDEYTKALDAAHGKFLAMERHYQRYIKPYREALWGPYDHRA
jgi:hypothetical protein